MTTTGAGNPSPPPAGPAPLGPPVALSSGPLGVVQTTDREIGRQTALRARAVVAFADSRPSAADRQPGEPGCASAATRAARPEILAPVSEWAAQELTVALSVSQTAAQKLLERSLTLVQKLPATLSALEAGAIGPGHLWPLLEQVAPIGDPAVRAQVEARLLDWVAGQVKTPAQLTEKTRRLVLLHDARGAAQRLQDAIRRRRGVYATPGREDGISALTAVLTTPESQACLQVLGQYADSLDDNPDDDTGPIAAGLDGEGPAQRVRTRAEKMADCLIDLILRPGDTNLPVVQAQLTVVASVQTLAWGDQPGEIDGQVVPAEVVRQLARRLGLVPDDTAPDDTGTGSRAAPDDTAQPAAATPGPAGTAQPAAAVHSASGGAGPADNPAEEAEDARDAAGWSPAGWSVAEWVALQAQLARETALAHQPGSEQGWPEHGIWLSTPDLPEDFEQLCWDQGTDCPQQEAGCAEHGIWLGSAATLEDLERLFGTLDTPCPQPPAAALPNPPLPDGFDTTAPTGPGAGTDAGGTWAAADAAVHQASVVGLAARAAAAAAERAVQAAELSAALEEAAWAASPAGWLTRAHDSLTALTHATTAQREAIAGLLTRTGGGGLVDRPRIAIVDALSGTLLALTDARELRRTAHCGRPACARRRAACTHDLTDRPGLRPPAETDGYRPAAELDRFVRARDRRCRQPGCRNRVPRGGQLDHDRSWPDGPTAVINLTGYCTRNHRGKHQAPGWTYHLHPDGRLTVTTPTGLTTTTRPPRYDTPALTALTPVTGPSPRQEEPAPF